MEFRYLIFGLILMFIGMGVVFCALFSLQIATTLISVIDKALFKKRAPKEEHDPSDEDIAIIAASVEAVLCHRVRIHRIRMIADHELEQWSHLGRLSIMNSHSPWQRKQ